MNVKSFLAMAALALFATVATGCSDDDDPVVDTPSVDDSSSQGVKEMTVSTSDYSLWTYINLKTGETQTATVAGPWKYIGGENEVLEEKDPEIKGTVPAEWDIAFHYYEIRTNNSQAVVTDAKELAAVKELPATGWESDKAVKAEDQEIIVDMKNMMQGKVGYADGIINPALCKWVTETPTGSMPPTIYTVTDNVYVVKCKDGNWAKLKFTDKLDGNGKKAIKFSYEYMSK